MLAHVYAARVVLPETLESGEGYLPQTALAVALSLRVDKANYTDTKHAALGRSQWLAANFHPNGLQVLLLPGRDEHRHAAPLRAVRRSPRHKGRAEYGSGPSQTGDEMRLPCIDEARSL